MNRRNFVIALAGAPLRAQEAGFGGPVLGYVLDADRHVRPLIGPAGSAYLASPLAEETGLRQWTGSYGLDADGQLFFSAGTEALRRVETEGGWQRLIGSARPDVAAVQLHGRVAIARAGVAEAAFELGMVADHLAVGTRGEAIAGADAAGYALWRADGAQVLQASLAGVRAIQVLPGGAGLCGLADGFFLVDEAGRREIFAVGRGSALAMTGDGSTVVILDEEGRKVQIFAVAAKEWREEKIPFAGRQLTSLRDGRSFLVTGAEGEPAWTLTLRNGEPHWAQIPLVRGGRN
jgi:hypothetical protein